MNYFTEISATGIIVNARFTTDPNTMVQDGHRLVLDMPPEPPVFNPLFERLIRVEPVDAAAQQVQYTVARNSFSINEHEVVL